MRTELHGMAILTVPVDDLGDLLHGVDPHAVEPE